MIKIDLGCGKHRIEGYVSIDKNEDAMPDFVVDIEHDKLPFSNGSVDFVRASNVIEHLDRDNIVFVFSEIYRVLKQGGLVWIKCPYPFSNTHYGAFTHKTALLPDTLSALCCVNSEQDRHWFGCDILPPFDFIEISRKYNSRRVFGWIPFSIRSLFVSMISSWELLMEKKPEGK